MTAWIESLGCARRWIEILDEGHVVGVCTAVEFCNVNLFAFNADNWADLQNLKEGETLGVGGGAGALVFVRWASDATQAKLEEIAASAGDIEIENVEAELALMRWSIWTTDGDRDIIGSGESFAEALDEALDTARVWAANSAEVTS